LVLLQILGSAGNHNLQVSLKSKHLLNLRIGLGLDRLPRFSTDPLGHIAFSGDYFFL